MSVKDIHKISKRVFYAVGSDVSVLEPYIDDENVSEDVRLKYRYLDIRRDAMKDKLVLRHKIVQAARNYLNNLDFLEVD